MIGDTSDFVVHSHNDDQKLNSLTLLKLYDTTNFKLGTIYYHTKVKVFMVGDVYMTSQLRNEEFLKIPVFNGKK